MRKIAIIGLGKFGTKLFERFNKYGNVKFVCGRKIKNNLLDLKNKYGVEVCNDYKKILDKVDMIVISTPSNTHYSITKECLIRGKDIFVEKPLSIKLANAEELVNLAREKGLKLYVDDVFLFRKEFRELERNIKGKKIRKIKFIWKKYGTFDDSIINAIVYHDMYMLIELLDEGEMANLEIIKKIEPLEKGRTDVLEFKFDYNGTVIECEYDRTCEHREKKMRIELEANKAVEWVDDKTIVDDKIRKLKTEDVLSTMIKAVLEDKVDYSNNNSIALKSIELMGKIKEKIGEEEQDY